MKIEEDVDITLVINGVLVKQTCPITRIGVPDPDEPYFWFEFSDGSQIVATGQVSIMMVKREKVD